MLSLISASRSPLIFLGPASRQDPTHSNGLPALAAVAREGRLG